MQLVRGVALLNATPFWTLFNSRRRAASGTVPLPAAAAAAINWAAFSRVADPGMVRKLLGQVYVDAAALSDELVARIVASARHPHAVDAAASMMSSPRGAVELGEMVGALSRRGVAVCMIHGARHFPAVTTAAKRLDSSRCCSFRQSAQDP